ncbi:MAG: carbamoyltransferase HypF [Candidatus Bathyarchaeia archaeon]
MQAEIIVSGIVQGVGFRPFVYRTAVNLGLRGFVRNRSDASVQVVVEGPAEKLREFVCRLKDEKPPLARIHDLTVVERGSAESFQRFEILGSSETSQLQGSTVPPDVSICESCIKELREPSNRRFEYFFITCTDCGPRFTIIERLPYDRKNTTMSAFEACPRCERDYRDPLDRRFHAQTVACPDCGPKAELFNSTGEAVEAENPIVEAGILLEEGSIVAVKGNGGFHIAASTTRDEPIARLRQTKSRREKPFAVMARDLETARTFAEVSAVEAELLTSYMKPILLLTKSPSYHLSPLISPGLHNVGVMLPYTGLHLMLFDQVREPAFVMTSANAPGEPIIARNEDAFKRMASYVDYFLVHNREVAHRCDDSVIRLVAGEEAIIRRSRGYAPAPITLGLTARRTVLALGGDLNVTTCVLMKDKAFLSQHIGDIERLETLQFLESAARHLLELTRANVEVIACDLHPGFLGSRLAERLGEEWNCPVVKVQHHHAHALSLMAEHSLDELVAVACDGVGYGADGEIWGGEVLFSDAQGYRRLSHLEYHPMVGGDLAARYPLRMAASMLRVEPRVNEWLMDEAEHLPHRSAEAQVILRGLKLGRWPLTSSCGRVLDAVSALLGVCYERTYEGEPAMKLESVARGGHDTLRLRPDIRIRDGLILTEPLAMRIFEERRRLSARDLAYSAEEYLARSLAEVAIDEASNLGCKTVGFTGGVAYNEHFVGVIRSMTEKAGMRFVTNRLVPRGDGGVSFGQAVAAAFTSR